MARATGKIGSAMPFEAANHELTGGGGEGRHVASTAKRERYRGRKV